VSAARAQGPRVTVYTREGCHLCEAAEADVARICGELGVGWHAVDVDADPELRAEYGDSVPVIMVDGSEHGFWRVEEPRLRAALA
jgi:glutaredoxin